MIITPTTIGALTVNANSAVKFAYLQRGISYIIVTTTADANGDVMVTFYDETYTFVQSTQYMPATTVCWLVDTTQ